MADEKNDNEQNDQDKPEPLTIDKVNEIVGARMARLEKAIEALSAIKPEPKKDEDAPEKMSRTAQLEATVKRLTEEREAEKNAARDLKMRTALKDSFAKYNVPETLRKALIAQLVDSDKLVSIDDDGTINFRGRAGETLDLELGLKDFFGSEEGKAFLPPKGVQGSNDRRQAGPGSSHTGQKMSEADADAALRALLSGDRL